MIGLASIRIRALMALVALAGVVAMAILFSGCGSGSDGHSANGENSQQTAATRAEPSENVGSPQSDASNPNVLVCIGDSITYGYGVARPSTDAWPALLGEKLGDGWEVHNLGVSGTTLLDEGGFPYRSTGNVERAKAADATMAIIMLGTNDAADSSWDIDSYRRQLKALVDELKATSSRDVQIVLMAPPCTFYGPVFESRHVGINDRIGGDIRAVVQELAVQEDARYVDLFAFTEGHPEWFPDQLHPDEAGNRAMADYIYSQLWG